MTKYSHSCVEYTVSDICGDQKPYIHIYARSEDKINVRKHFVIEGFEPFFLITEKLASQMPHLVLNNKIVRIERDSIYKVDLYENPLLKIVVKIPKDVSDPKTEDGLLQTIFKPEQTFLGNIRFDENFLICSGITEGFEISDELERSENNPKFDDLKPTSIQSILRRIFIDIEINDFERKNVKIGEAYKYPEAEITILTIFDNISNKFYTLSWHPSVITSKKIKKKYTFPFSKKIVDWEILLYKNEKEMLTNFLSLSSFLDWDQSCGWNVHWDWCYLISRLQELRMDYYQLSPLDEVYISDGTAIIKGRIITDHLAIYRQMEKIKQEKKNYKLETISNDVLGVGKIQHRGKTIGNLWKNNLEKALMYNSRDTALCAEIEEQTRYLGDYDSRRRDCGCEWDNIIYPDILPNFYRYRAAREDGIALPTKSIRKKIEKGKGGYVGEPSPGVHHWVIVLDFKTLYPSIQVMLNMSPETMYRKKTRAKNILELYLFISKIVAFCGCPPYVSNNKMFFRRKPDGFSKKLLLKLIKQRDEQKKLAAKLGKELGWKHPQTIAAIGREKSKKSGTNAYTGIMDKETDILFDPELFDATTTTARACTLKGKSLLEKDLSIIIKLIDEKLRIIPNAEIKEDLKVIYSDTDSLMLEMKGFEIDKLSSVGEIIQNYLNEKLRVFVQRRFKASLEDSKILQLRFESIYESFFMTLKKDDSGGSKKKYAGLKVKELTSLGWVDRDEIELKGFESKKSDTSEVVAKFGKKILEMILRGKTLEEIRTLLVKLRKKYLTSGFNPSEFCKSTGISKSLEEYGKMKGGKKINIPPQIRGAMYANTFLSAEFRSGDKPFWGYVIKTPAGIPKTDVIAFYEDFEIANFEFDLKKMWEVEVVSKLDIILSGIGKSVDEFLYPNRQVKVFNLLKAKSK